MDKEYIEIIKALTPTILGGIGVVITLIYSAANKKLNHQKMEKELFKEFNERYDTLNEDLRCITSETKFEDLNLLVSKTAEGKTLDLVLIDYFNLCAEEYYWKKRKRIGTEIWNAWHEGMMYYYRFPVVKALWERERSLGWRSYYLEKNEDFFKLKK